jgi:FKBP-type peptidyl-prolyl cis-trans isomerase
MKNALADVVNERLRNAFLANFLLAWIFVNHSLVFYFVFSDDLPNEKLRKLDGLSFQWSSDLFYPLLLVLLYIYVMPIINLVLMKIRLKFVSPLLNSHRNAEKKLNYDSDLDVENKRLDLVMREKERELDIEERRTELQKEKIRSAEQETEAMAKRTHQAKQEADELARKQQELSIYLDYKSIADKQTALSLKEKALEAEKERLRDKAFSLDIQMNDFAWVDIEKTAEEGDKLIIDFKGFIDGQPFEGGQAESFPIELGAGRMIPGFEEKLIGHSASDGDFSIQVTFPDNYHQELLRSKLVTFSVRILGIQTRVIPLSVLKKKNELI